MLSSKPRVNQSHFLYFRRECLKPSSLCQLKRSPVAWFAQEEIIKMILLGFCNLLVYNQQIQSPQQMESFPSADLLCECVN